MHVRANPPANHQRHSEGPLQTKSSKPAPALPVPAPSKPVAHSTGAACLFLTAPCHSAFTPPAPPPPTLP